MDNLALITQSTGLLFKGEEISEEDCLVFIFSDEGCYIYQGGPNVLQQCMLLVITGAWYCPPVAHIVHHPNNLLGGPSPPIHC